MSAGRPSPSSYSSLPFKDIKISHVPADSPTVSKVLVVAFNRPEKYNAVTDNLLTELETAYGIIDGDDRVRAVVLTGTGKAFCAGSDLEVGFSGIAASNQSEEAIESYRDQCVFEEPCYPTQVHMLTPMSRGGRVALAMTNCSKPTIVALNGPAAGFGFTITFPAAIRVAWSGAKVTLPFARRGITLESCSAFFLPRLLGMAKAMHLATTGATYLASDPLVNPLFSQLLPTPQATVDYAVKLATDIAENTSTTSTKLIRDLLLYSPDTPEETHLLESRVFLSVVGSKDNVEGVESFMEKRKPVFSGSFNRESMPFWPWWGSRGNGKSIVKL